MEIWVLIFGAILLALQTRSNFLTAKMLKKMDNALQTYETFLTTIGGYFTSISTSLETIAKGINPSGLTAADAAQLQTDLQALANAGKTAADAAASAASASAAGQPAPAAPAASAANATAEVPGASTTAHGTGA